VRDNVGLNARQQKFVDLVAAGQHSISQCHALAGYGDPKKPDSANAHALKVRLAEHIAEARAKLGFSDAEESATVDDEEVAALLKQARETHRLLNDKVLLPIQVL